MQRELQFAGILPALSAAATAMRLQLLSATSDLLCTASGRLSRAPGGLLPGAGIREDAGPKVGGQIG